MIILYSYSTVSPRGWAHRELSTQWLKYTHTHAHSLTTTETKQKAKETKTKNKCGKKSSKVK